MTQQPIPNPHDGFFKATFSRLEVVQLALHHFLSPDVRGSLKLETLEPDKDSFVDDELRQSFSDLVFQAETAEGGPARVCFLLEHKSAPDPLTAFQTLKYTIRVNEWRLRDGLRPCCVIPIVIYHGPTPWNVPRDVADLIECPRSLMRFLPRFSYELIDLGTMWDGLFAGHAFAQAAMMTLKYIMRPELGERLGTILDLTAPLLSRPGGRDDVLTFLQYLTFGTREIDSETLRMAVNNSFQADGDVLLGTIAEQWVLQGMEKGMEKGIEKGMVKGLTCGELIGQIRAFQEVLRMDVESMESLQPLEQTALEAKLSELRRRLPNG